MPFVKLDTNILNSTLWFEKSCRDIFLTALLMAEPVERDEPEPQLAIRSLDETGWIVPAGKYGFVPAASVGIIRRAIVEDEEHGLDALEKLGAPEEGSRTKEFDGRRLVRVDGGFIVLNYFKYRDQDYTAALRSKRYRERKKEEERHAVASTQNGVTTPNVTSPYASALSVLKEGVRGRFEKWIQVRKDMGKKPKNWESMFLEQAEWLQQFSESAQIEIISASIRNNWQGLFPPKQNSNGKPNPPKTEMKIV